MTSGPRRTGTRFHAALAVCYLEISILTPTGSPRVLTDPAILGVIIPDHADGVIPHKIAVVVCVNSTGVIEEIGVHFHAGHYRAIGSDPILGVGYRLPRGYLCNAVGSIRAGSVAIVRPTGFVCYAGRLGSTQSTLKLPTITARPATEEQICFRQIRGRLRVASGYLDSRFNRGDRSKTYTRSTVALVLIGVTQLAPLVFRQSHAEATVAVMST